MTSDAEDKEPHRASRTNERGEDPVLFPSDVARAILGSDPKGAPGFVEIQDRLEVTKSQKRALVASGLLAKGEFLTPAVIDAQGTEHVVRFCGRRVEKHQRAEAWVPVLSEAGLLTVSRAVPTEYLRRLELQNEMFGDDVRITSMTRGDRFVITQPTLRGAEPSEIEIRDVLEGP